MKSIGILDPTGKYNNPLTDTEYSKEYKDLAKIWSNFPAYKIRDQVIESIKNNQVTLCIAATGSGKTVLVPKYALHAFDYTGKIAITLPKQIIAKSAAEFAAKTLDVNVGDQVGYQYKNAPKGAKSNNTKLLYATDGTIVARLMNDPKLTEFNAVIIDEAHERKMQIDLLFYLLKETLRLRPEFRIVIMSATIDSAIFKQYYKDFSYKEFNISGERNYPIESIFLDKEIDYKDAVNKGYEIIKSIVDTQESGDILFFVTSSNEAFDVCKKLDKYIKQDNTFCVEVYAGMDPKKQELAQDEVMYKDLERENNKAYKFKLVVATNVAESSLTISGIKYVIDSGYELHNDYDAKIRGSKLDRDFISHAQAMQRLGRAGRTAPGICYHLYTKKQFENMKKFPDPDIKKVDITSECLKLLANGDVKSVPKLLEVLTQFIEPPKEINIVTAIQDLESMSLINNGDITKFGELVSSFGNDIYSSIAILLGKIYKCSYEIIDIMSFINACKANMNEVFRFPEKTIDKEDRNASYDKLLEKFYGKMKHFKHKYGDHMSLLNIYQEYKEMLTKNSGSYQKMDEWCYKYFLKNKTLTKVHMYARNTKNNLRGKVGEILDPDSIGVKYIEEIDKLRVDDRVMCCLMMAYRLKTAIQKKDGHTHDNAGLGYVTQFAKNIKINIPNNSFINLSKQNKKNIFYEELFISMGNASLNIVSKMPDDLVALIK